MIHLHIAWSESASWLGVPLPLYIEVKSIYEATRFLARNVSPSWRVTLGFLVLFCRSYSGR